MNAWLDVLEKGRTDILECCVDPARQRIHARDSAQCNERNHQGILDEVLTFLALKRGLANEVQPVDQIVQFRAHSCFLASVAQGQTWNQIRTQSNISTQLLLL